MLIRAAATDYQVVQVSVQKQLLVGCRVIPAIEFANPLIFAWLRWNLEQKGLAIAEILGAPFIRFDAVRPWLWAEGTEYWVVHCLDDYDGGLVVLDLVEEGHETRAVYVGWVDDLELQDLVAGWEPSPDGGDLLGAQDLGACVLHRKCRKVEVAWNYISINIKQAVCGLFLDASKQKCYWEICIIKSLRPIYLRKPASYS